MGDIGALSTKIQNEPDYAVEPSLKPEVASVYRSADIRIRRCGSSPCARHNAQDRWSGVIVGTSREPLTYNGRRCWGWWVIQLGGPWAQLKVREGASRPSDCPSIRGQVGKAIAFKVEQGFLPSRPLHLDSYSLPSFAPRGREMPPFMPHRHAFYSTAEGGLLGGRGLGQRTYLTLVAARQDVFNCIKMFYNPTRKHTNNVYAFTS